MGDAILLLHLGLAYVGVSKYKTSRIAGKTIDCESSQRRLDLASLLLLYWCGWPFCGPLLLEMVVVVLYHIINPVWWLIV